MFNLNKMSAIGNLIKAVLPALAQWLSLEENELLMYQTPAQRAEINQLAAKAVEEVTGTPVVPVPPASPAK